MSSKENLFTSLSKHILKRNTETGEYTLEDERLDSFFGINDIIALAPNPEDIARFASLVYLLGRANYEIISFVAVAAGYIASFKQRTKDGKEGETKTFFISSYEEDNIRLLNEIYKSTNLEEIPSNTSIIDYAWKKRIPTSLDKFYESLENKQISKDKLKYLIDKTISNIRRKLIKKSREKQTEKQITESLDLLSEEEMMKIISETLDSELANSNIVVSEEEKNKIKEYMKSILFIISFEKINIYNCDMNNMVMCGAIFSDSQEAKDVCQLFDRVKVSGYKDYEKKTDDELKQLIKDYYQNRKYDEANILKKLKYFIALFVAIIDNYFEYMNVNNNNSQLLNQKTSLQSFLSSNLPQENKPDIKSDNGLKSITTELGNSKDDWENYLMATALNNVCATDYTADALSSYLKALSGYEDCQETLEETISKTIPGSEEPRITTEKNNADKSKIREQIIPSKPRLR